MWSAWSLWRVGLDFTGKQEVIPQSASRKFNLTASKIRRHCPRRVYARTRKTLEVVLTHRLHFGWRWPNAAELRADAKAGGGMAAK